MLLYINESGEVKARMSDDDMEWSIYSLPMHGDNVCKMLGIFATQLETYYQDIRDNLISPFIIYEFFSVIENSNINILNHIYTLDNFHLKTNLCFDFYFQPSQEETMQ